MLESMSNCADHLPLGVHRERHVPLAGRCSSFSRSCIRPACLPTGRCNNKGDSWLITTAAAPSAGIVHMMDSVQQELADADLPVYIHTLSPGMVLTGASWHCHLLPQ